MRVLVTGGAGYIGSTVARQLIETGYDVVVLDNLSQGNRAAVPDAATFVHGDLRDQELVHRTLADHRPDAIMHFASHTLVGESMEKPLLYLDDNVRCGANLMRAAVEHDVGRFILSSTANLFGLPERIPIDEEVEIDPGSPYGESKFILERMLHWLDEIHDLQYAALRYFNAAGAAGPDQGEDHDPETHLIPLVLQVALGQREKIVIFGDDYDTPDGTCVRDYIHVVDLAQAHIRALEALRVTGREIPAEVGDPRPGDPAVLIASSEKICEELGWAPEYGDLDDIIGSAWEWHRRHPHGYETDGHAN
ncbi:MAG: UDP-glucose 4-epimerase GalE [Bacteroidetes bacterium QS_1_63_11]|nr:MAG: UDP-glucose 4-epimerase GalE [Bacteroidetes bacterium QS_1_63_11]